MTPAFNTWSTVAHTAVNDFGALQDPVELTVLLGILAGGRPERVIEIGTWAGGLSWALAQLPEVRTVVTVDRLAGVGGARSIAWVGSPIVCVQGDSTDPGTRDKVTAALGGQLADVLVIDGGHDYQTAVSDWQLYTPLVAGDGLVVMHDTQGCPGRPDVEVPQLWAKITREHKHLELVAHHGGPFGTGIVWP